MSEKSYPFLGFGLGLRTKHYPYIFEHQPAIDWFEIISENFMDTDGKPKRNLARIKEHYPIVMHGVSLSIGTVDPLHSDYLHKLKALIDWVKPMWISDHICWTGVAHKNAHDLLPLPYTEEALTHIIERIKQVQDVLERPIALENPSTYLEFTHSSMPETEFIARMVEESGCYLLLDVNNVYVTCYNHRLDAKAYLDALPLDQVIQIHLSGHHNKGTHIIDTHDAAVIDEVWNLYKYVVHKAGRIPNTMIEWDGNIPAFPELESELLKAKAAAASASAYLLPNLYREEMPQRANENISLHQAQITMQDAIMLGNRVDTMPQRWIRAKEGFTPEAQLEVYINAYRYRLYDVVAEDYPVLQHYLGKEAFYTLILAFVNTVQPTHFNIGRFALKLPGFMKEYIPQDECAYALCQLETAIAQLNDPEETAPLQQQHLEGMTADDLLKVRLYPRKALDLMVFSYPVNSYYQQVMDDASPEQPKPETSYLAVFRHEDVVWRMELEKQEYHLLQQLFSGMIIGDALEGMDESAAEKLSTYFSRWMRHGMLAAHNYTNLHSQGTHNEAA